MYLQYTNKANILLYIRFMFVYIWIAVFREQFSRILYTGFRQVNPNIQGDHRPIKSQETVPLTLLFECKQPKEFLI